MAIEEKRVAVPGISLACSPCMWAFIITAVLEGPQQHFEATF